MTNVKQCIKRISSSLFVLAVSVFSSSLVFAEDGNVLFQQCAACHGDQGQGNQALNTPVLAGQFAWYTSRQIELFQQKLRGAHDKDIYGKQMIASVQNVTTAAEVSTLANYIAQLPKPQATIAQVDGDTMKNGHRYYQAKCGACHGGSAEGNESFKAPKLSGQNIVYLQRQMANFKNGSRGYIKEDKYGRQMAMMSKTVSDQELADILQFIAQQ